MIDVLSKEQPLDHPPKPKWHGTVWSSMMVIAFFGIGIYFGVQRMDWTVGDSIYFIVVTMSTVGYGDFSADTQEHKMFLCFYIIFGVVFIGNIVQDFVEDAAEKLREEMVDLSDGDTDEEQHEENMATVYSYRTLTHVITLCGIIFGGAAFYMYNEEHEDGSSWSYIDGLYWSICTLTTVGYGDMSLTKWYTRTFSIFYILIGIAAFATTFNSVAAAKAKRGFHQKRMKMSQLQLTSKLVKDMDDGEDGVSSGEFLMYCLAELKIVSKNDCKTLLAKFAELDVSGNGKLDHEDLMHLELALSEKRKAEKAVAKTHQVYPDKNKGLPDLQT